MSTGGGFGRISHDRSVRSLANLERTASTSRALNLAAIARLCGEDPLYAAQPLFMSRTLNTALIVKHRLRADERAVLHGARQVMTKVIVPFSKQHLGLGGRSVFVGGPQWSTFLDEVCGAPADRERDRQVMALIDGLPSLDPFLLRENLRRHGIEVAPCYFTISEADILRMRQFVSKELRGLVAIASGGSTDPSRATARVVEALMSVEFDDRLEVLGQTLRLEGDAFRDGMFSWKGFLYYKWLQASIAPELAAVLQELDRLVLTGPKDPDAQAYFEKARKRLKVNIVAEGREVAAALKVYNDALRDLTDNGQPGAFRQFLLKAPEMFVTLGEKLGAISHIASFWRYRFPEGRLLRMPAAEGLDLIRDFEDGLCVQLEI